MNANTTNTPKLAHPVAPVVQKTSSAASTSMPTALAVAQPPVADAAQAKWADRINERLRKGQEALIAAGNDLIAAKAALGHGRFGAMFKSGIVKTDQRTAEMLMRVAAHPALSNSSNCSKLPHSLRSLDKLATLEPVVIEQGIKAGAITPTMTSADAGSFVRSKLDTPSKKATKAAAAEPAVALEPESPAVTDDKTSAPARTLDVQAFKAALTQFLECEYAKAPRASAVEMQAAAAAVCSGFFSSRTTTTIESTEAVNSVVRVSGESKANSPDLPPGKHQENARVVQQSESKGSNATTASARTRQTVPVFRKSYPLTDEERARLDEDLATLKSAEPSSREYYDALRHVVDTGHYLAVAGSFDAFCADFLLRDAAVVKLALESEQSASQSKPSEQSPPASVQMEPKRQLTLKEKIAMSKQAARVTA